jgi:hypothetical protein
LSDVESRLPHSTLLTHMRKLLEQYFHHVRVSYMSWEWVVSRRAPSTLWWRS